MIGKVKWFNDSKGFGFITSDDRDYFVHYTEIKKDGFKTVAEGASVEFDVYESDKGAVAKNVRIL